MSTTEVGAAFRLFPYISSYPGLEKAQKESSNCEVASANNDQRSCRKNRHRTTRCERCRARQTVNRDCGLYILLWLDDLLVAFEDLANLWKDQ
jgi:hypothetical protein